MIRRLALVGLLVGGLVWGSANIAAIVLGAVAASTSTAASYQAMIGACLINGVNADGVAQGPGYMVASYNILHANVTAKQAGFKGDADDWKWSNRGPRVVQHINNVAPDLIGLQEAQLVRGTKTRQMDMIKAGTSLAWLFADTSNPIGYNRAAFTVLDQGRIRINDNSEPAVTATRYVNWVKLRATSDGSQVWFLNLHAQVGRTTAAAKARSRAWDRIVAGLKKIQADNVIMVGDFNASNNESRKVFNDHLTKLPAAGFVAAPLVGRMVAPVAHLSSYNGWGDTIGGKFRLGAINRTATGRTIDYVWTRGAATPTTWQIYTGPTLEWRTIGGERVPFATDIPSDHWLVLSHVTLGAGSASTSTSAATAAVTSTEQSTSSATTATVDGFNASQMGIAAKIVAAGKYLQLDSWSTTVGVMTGIGESSLTNVDYGDAAGPDSRGVFQQRSTGWGTYEERMNPYKAALSFFRALLKVPGYHNLEPTIAAHRTQRNADPYHYAKFWGQAVKIVSAIENDPNLLSLAQQDSGNLECGEAGPDGSLTVPATGSMATTIKFGLGLVGKWPYAWGGGNINGPSHGIPGGPGSNLIGFDCSGFTQYVIYQGLGIDIGGDSRTQAAWFNKRGWFTRTNGYTQLQAGDVLFFARGSSLGSIYHVALVTQPGWIVEAPGGGRYIQHNQIKDRMPYDIIGFGRFPANQTM